MEAVKQNCYAIQYVQNQTEALCLEAVKRDGYALEYVKNQTEAICLEAIKQNVQSIVFIEYPTLFLICKIIELDPKNAKYIDNDLLISLKNKYTEFYNKVIKNITDSHNTIYYKPHNIGASLCEYRFKNNVGMQIDRHNKINFLFK